LKESKGLINLITSIEEFKMSAKSESGSLSKATVQHIAKLARLEISEAEAQAMSAQLSAVLDNFNELAKVDTKGVEPLITPSDIEMNLRVDEVKQTEPPQTMLENASDRSGHLFTVPPVV